MKCQSCQNEVEICYCSFESSPIRDMLNSEYESEHEPIEELSQDSPWIEVTDTGLKFSKAMSNILKGLWKDEKR